jgi:hypothetical protein
LTFRILCWMGVAAALSFNSFRSCVVGFGTDLNFRTGESIPCFWMRGPVSIFRTTRPPSPAPSFGTSLRLLKKCSLISSFRCHLLGIAPCFLILRAGVCFLIVGAAVSLEEGPSGAFELPLPSPLPP